jgi:hypothetical protein
MAAGQSHEDLAKGLTPGKRANRKLTHYPLSRCPGLTLFFFSAGFLFLSDFSGNDDALGLCPFFSLVRLVGTSFFEQGCSRLNGKQ